MAASSTGDDVQFDDSFVIVPDSEPFDSSRLVEALNSVYSAESCSLFRYLETWSPYTDTKTLALRSAARRMMRLSFEHSDVLAHLIGQAGGVTVMGAFPESSSSLNDTGWAFLVPRLIRTKRDMGARYERALRTIESMGHGVDSGVCPALRQLLDENQQDLAELESWQSRLSG